MYRIMTAKELIALNKEKAEKWMRECPKSHKLKNYVQIVEEFMCDKLIIRNGSVLTLEIGDFTIGAKSLNKHADWMPSAIPYCNDWEIDEAARAAHDAKIHEIRSNTPNHIVYSDIGSLRVEADGVELLFGGVGGDGEHRVFFTVRKGWRDETLLSLFGRSHDEYICTFKAKHVRIFQYDCPQNGNDPTICDTVFEEKETFNIYNVYDRLQGWKIERQETK